jgi:hypothetical protein
MHGSLNAFLEGPSFNTFMSSIICLLLIMQFSFALGVGLLWGEVGGANGKIILEEGGGIINLQNLKIRKFKLKFNFLKQIH